MTVPLIILAFLSIFGGWFAAPHLVGGIDHFEASWIRSSRLMRLPAAGVEQASLADPQRVRRSSSPAMDLFHALTGLAGDRRRCSDCSLAWWFYIKKPGDAQAPRGRACTACTRSC